MPKTRWKKAGIVFPEQLWSILTKVAETFGRRPEELAEFLSQTMLYVAQRQTKILELGPRIHTKLDLRKSPCRVRLPYLAYGFAMGMAHDSHNTTSGLMVKLDWLGVEFLQVFCNHTKRLPSKEDFERFVVSELSRHFSAQTLRRGEDRFPIAS